MLRPLALSALLLASPAWGQGSPGALPAGALSSSVVVLDRDLLFARSLFGRRIVADIETASIALASENRIIEAELEAEERALTERRETMEPEAFRALAIAFDEKVVGMRQTQDAKARSLQQRSERAQAMFFERANPVLIELVQEVGALVILDRRIVIAAADRVDITALARERIDAALGEGEGLAPTDQDPTAPVRTDPAIPGDVTPEAD